MSEEWTRLTGQPVEAALGLGWTAFTTPEETATILEWLASPLEPATLRARFRLRRPDGGAAALVGAFHKGPHGFEGVAVELPGPGEARVDARSEALVAALPDTVIQVDGSGVCTGARTPPVGEPVIDPQAWVGRPVASASPPSLALITHAAVEAAVRTRSPQTMEGELTEGRAFEVRAMPLEAAGAVVLVRDITEHKRAEARLVRAREEALSASRHKSHFLAAVSHEIRTPLNGVLGVAQLLRTWELPAEAQEYLGVLESAGDDLLALVNDVLDLSRIEANRLELNVSEFDLAAAVGEVLRPLTQRAARKGLTIAVEHATAARGQVRGDAVRFSQVLGSLVSNAITFSEQGEVRVTIDRPHRDDEVRVQVRDSGPGIPEAERPLVFEPFSRGATSRQRHAGTGLGLSIARELARLMGGELSFESLLGVGTTFEATLRLPGAGEPPALSLRPSPPPRRLWVLVAEDNELNARMTQALVTQLGHSVTVVRDGIQAVDAVRAGTFDVVIMDVAMPGMDGLEATRAIRALEAGTGRHTPIIALTAMATKGDDLVCLSAGMDAYLAKPVTAESLKDLLTWFGGARTGREGAVGPPRGGR